MLHALITSGRIIDLMLIALIVEVTAIQAYRLRSGGGIALLPLLLNLGAGGSLMLALRALLTNANWLWVGMFLSSALLFHVADIVQRWERPSARVGPHRAKNDGSETN